MKVFLSYGHDDNAELVVRIKNDLEKLKFNPWFDADQIKPGDDWRLKITEGISKSHKIIAFLSKHTVRDPGVCRDEIAIALGIKHGAIGTILVEALREEELPVTVGHIQRLDMSQWKTFGRQGEPAFEDWYQNKLQDIVELINRNQQYSQDMEVLAEKLHPLDQNSLVGSMLRDGFIGREWLTCPP
jgi:hypothetical protein